MSLFHKKNALSLERTPDSTFIMTAYDGKGSVPVFDQAGYFQLFVFERGKKIDQQMYSLANSRHSEIVKLFADLHIDLVIARAYSPRALHDLHEAHIRTAVFDGGPHAAIRAWREGRLQEM